MPPPSRRHEGLSQTYRLGIATVEDGAGWLAFLRGLRARGLKGVELVISDAHPGLKDAIASVLRGATWQRCRTHFMRSLLTKEPKSAQGLVATFVRTIFAQPDAESVRAQHARTVEQLQPRFKDAARMLAEAAEILAFTAFPKEHWRQIWSNNPQERLNREIRRRTDVVGIFPHRPSIVRLVGAVLPASLGGTLGLEPPCAPRGLSRALEHGPLLLASSPRARARARARLGSPLARLAARPFGA